MSTDYHRDVGRADCIPTTSVVTITVNDNCGGERAKECGPCPPEDGQMPPTNSSPTREHSNMTTYSGALLHLLKSSLGTGILAMPNAFKNGGLVFGLVGTAAVGFLCTHCIYLLVTETHTPPEWHFPLRVWMLILIVPLVPLGIIRTFRLLVPFSAMAMIFILVGLSCTIMWVLIGVSPFAGKSPVPLPDIQSRPWMAPVTHLPLFFATVLFAMEGIGTVLPIENSMRQPQKFLTARPCGVLNFAMTLVVFMYSVIGFLGYLRFGNSTAGSITLNLPNDFFAEIVKVMVALSILFSYGLQFCVPSEIVWTHLEPWLHKRRQKIKNVKEQETSNLAAPNTFVSSSVNATTENFKTISEERLFEKLQSEKAMTGAYYTMRVLMILGTVFISTFVPDLAPFISLIGAVFYSILGLFCPAVIHLVVFWHSGDDDLNCDGDYYTIEEEDDSDSVTSQQPRRRISGRSTDKSEVMSRWTVFKDLVIISIALIALVSGTYISIMNIIAVRPVKNNTLSTVNLLSGSKIFMFKT